MKIENWFFAMIVATLTFGFGSLGADTPPPVYTKKLPPAVRKISPDEQKLWAQTPPPGKPGELSYPGGVKSHNQAGPWKAGNPYGLSQERLAAEQAELQAMQQPPQRKGFWRRAFPVHRRQTQTQRSVYSHGGPPIQFYTPYSYRYYPSRETDDQFLNRKLGRYVNGPDYYTVERYQVISFP